MGNTQTKEARPASAAPGASPAGSSSSPGSSSTPRAHRSSAALVAAAVKADKKADKRLDKRPDKRSSSSKSSKSKSDKSRSAEGHLVVDESEMVDGGYLVPQGVYSGPQDFKVRVVRMLMIERRLAPFYKGLSDFDSSWTERQMLAAVRGLPVTSAELPEPTHLDTLAESLATLHPGPTSSANGSANGSASTGSALSSALKKAATTPSSPAVPSITFSEDMSPADSPAPDRSGKEKVTTSAAKAWAPLSLPDRIDAFPHHDDDDDDSSSHVDKSSQTSRTGDSSEDSPPASILSEANPASIDLRSRAQSVNGSIFAADSDVGESATRPSSVKAGKAPDTDALASRVASSLSISASVDVLKAESSHIEDAGAKLAAPRATPTTRNRSNTSSRYMTAPVPQKPSPPLEVLLYRNAIECPICFLYYPNYMNTTRCCNQAICSECFVQIKRADPHPPYHGESNGASSSGNNNSHSSRSEAASLASAITSNDILVSEPACCPYCAMPEFGVVYIPSPYRAGIPPPSGTSSLRAHISSLSIFSSRSGSSPLGGTPRNRSSSALSNLPSGAVTPNSMGARRGSLPPNAPEVVTTDQIRPDWSIKLTRERQHLARRSAAANALHASAFLLDSQGNVRTPAGNSSLILSGSSSGSGRRTERLKKRASRLRGLSNPSPSASSSPSPSASLSSMAGMAMANAPSPRATPASRRYTTGGGHRLRDIEDMMMVEAIRRSLNEGPEAASPASSVHEGGVTS